MKMFRSLFPLMAIALLSNVVVAQSDSQEKDLPSAESILMKHIDATGGVENYKKVKTMSAEGTISVPAAGIEGTMTMKAKFPGKVAVVADLGGVGKTVQGSDGKYAWMENPMMGSRLVEGDEKKQLSDQSNMDRYISPKDYFKSMKTIGIEDANGEDAYRVELEKKDGNKQTEFYSVKSGLLVQTIVKVEIAGMGDMEVTMQHGDYKKTGDLKSAHKMVQKLPVGGGMEQVMEFDKLEYNVEIDESEFVPPAEIKKLIAKKEAKGDDDSEKID